MSQSSIFGALFDVLRGPHGPSSIGTTIIVFDTFRIDNLPEGALDELVKESLAEGYRHIQRLSEDYASAHHRFDRRGEALYGVFEGERLIAVGGLTQGGDGPPDAGRVRRVYVLSAYRRRGVGRRLMEAIVEEGRQHYEMLVLRTDSRAAGLFYVSLGFKATSSWPESTHVLDLS